MTVAELITHLQTMPPDAIVIYRMHSESTEMDKDQVFLSTDDMIERNGTYMLYQSRWWDFAKDGPPKFVATVNFPGN